MNKKKLLLAALCTFVTLPACAQYMGPHPFLAAKGTMDMDPAYRARQTAALKRTLATVLTLCTGGLFTSCEGKPASAISTNDWQSLVKGEERQIQRNGPLGTSFYALTTPSFKQQPVAAQDQEVYQQRFKRLEAALHANATLQNYKLAVPNPADLVMLGTHSTWTFEMLLNWLSDPNSPKQMECSKQVPGVIGISFTEPTSRQVAFNLWIDARAKTVYLLKNGKYYGEK